MKTLTITVKSCNSSSISHTTNVRSNSTPNDAFSTAWETAGYDLSPVDFAVSKIFGKNCFFFQSGGQPVGYGQIFKPAKTGGNTSVTGLVRVEVVSI